MIRFEQVSKVYPDRTTAVNGLSFEVGEGEPVMLVGPSGCGKSPTMMTVNRQVGLFPHRTVLDNTATVPALAGRQRARARERASGPLDPVGLDQQTYGPRHPVQLSGGRHRRAGLTRALAADPPVLLMEEPFGAVDPVVRERLQKESLNLRSRVRKTVPLVTHAIEEAVRARTAPWAVRRGAWTRGRLSGAPLKQVFSELPQHDAVGVAVLDGLRRSMGADAQGVGRDQVRFERSPDA
ncbi:ATP-binding cassette domain-containing protein [Streptomyces sp. NPDC088746]|uniref:ATP-binding cassette domain-containing protein n=1 Tax=Streptomyces sp. NPDC088746 TaxID=3365885 RepID=UPI0037FB9493